MTRSLRRLSVLICFILAFSAKCFAGGFPTRPGRLLLSPSISYLYANKTWDSTGHLARYPLNGNFRAMLFTLYAEYGISRRFAATAMLPYTMNSFRQTGYSIDYSGLTDVEVGLKYYLANINFKYYFTLQATGIAPLYTDPIYGYKEPGAEFKASFSVRGTIFNRSYYALLEDGAREYFGAQGPFQNRYNGSFGLTLDTKFKNQVSLSVAGINSFSTNKSLNAINPQTGRYFNFVQASLGYGHSFGAVSAFINGGHFITGRNTADGFTGSFSLVFRIDTK